MLEHCDPSACVEFGTVFSQCAARIGANVYIGPYCQIGRADIGAETMLSAGVHVPSGPGTHGTARLDIPMRLQPGNLRIVRIGRDCWIGSAAVVMADVGEQTIVAAGAVVTRSFPRASSPVACLRKCSGRVNPRGRDRSPSGPADADNDPVTGQSRTAPRREQAMAPTSIAAATAPVQSSWRASWLAPSAERIPRAAATRRASPTEPAPPRHDSPAPTRVASRARAG